VALLPALAHSLVPQVFFFFTTVSVRHVVFLFPSRPNLVFTLFALQVRPLTFSHAVVFLPHIRIPVIVFLSPGPGKPRTRSLWCFVSSFIRPRTPHSNSVLISAPLPWGSLSTLRPVFLPCIRAAFFPFPQEPPRTFIPPSSPFLPCFSACQSPSLSLHNISPVSHRFCFLPALLVRDGCLCRRSLLNPFFSALTSSDCQFRDLFPVPR